MAQPPKEEEKKELPPIEEVACTEAVFMEKQVKPAIEATKEEVKVENFGDDTPLAKAVVMKLWDTAL